jgi:hypothetical protein
LWIDHQTARALVSCDEHQARMTAAEGVQVLPAGVAPIAVAILVVAFVTFVVGLIITTLCINGEIKDGNTCALGVA